MATCRATWIGVRGGPRRPPLAMLLLSLGLVALGALTGHTLAFRMVQPDAERRHRALDETGHAYFDPALLGSLAAALVVIGFAFLVVSGTGQAERGPSRLLVLAPPLGFAVQEHAERMLHHDALLTTIAEPTFLVGLALQIPFAFVSLLAARALLAAAGALSRKHGSPPRPKLVPEASLATPGACWIPVDPVLSGAGGQRAPPLALR